MDSGIVVAAFGCWLLESFGGGELLDIAIPTLRPLFYPISGLPLSMQ